MAIYRFRVSFEEFDDVYRDIDLLSSQTFEQFHYAIQESIGFDASKPASFFMSNDYWKKGQEITSREHENHNESNSVAMRDSRLSDYIADPHQKIYYVFDAPSQWTFFIELFKILPESETGKKYPVCVKSHGDAPKQYLVVEPPKSVIDPELAEDDLFSDLIVDDEAEEEAGEDADMGFEEQVDEEEYDNIEEGSEEEGKEELP